MKNNMIIHIDIGPVSVVSYTDKEGFFWLDSRDNMGAGPFNFISTALEHYASYRQDKQPPRSQNVIYVDFNSKRRVS